jgi:hypothetical protein
MQTRNTTFKLRDDELALLQSLADEMRCSRTDVLRQALVALGRTRQDKRVHAEAFAARLFEGIPEGSTLMVGLDEDLAPYATIDGRERRPDIVVHGEQVEVRGEDYVRVLVVDPDSDLRLDAGIIRATTGGWVALMEPYHVTVAT